MTDFGLGLKRCFRRFFKFLKNEDDGVELTSITHPQISLSGNLNEDCDISEENLEKVEIEGGSNV